MHLNLWRLPSRVMIHVKTLNQMLVRIAITFMALLRSSVCWLRRVKFMIK